MFRWFALVGLRMRTISVIEREYGVKLEVAGGPDSALFNKATRTARDLGGNEYDAAALFTVADATARLKTGAAGRIGLLDMLEITTERQGLMKRPDIVLELTERAFESVHD